MLVELNSIKHSLGQSSIMNTIFSGFEEGTGRNKPIELGFNTPPKLKSHPQSVPEYLAPYFSSKIKDIASNIRFNTCRRFRLKKVGDEVKMVLWSEMKQISPSTQDQLIPADKQDLTIGQIEGLIKHLSAKLKHFQNEGAESRSKLWKLMQKQINAKRHRLVIERKVKILKAKNRNKNEYIVFYNYLRQNIHKLQLWKLSLHKQLIICKENIQALKQSIKQLPNYDIILAQRKRNYDQLTAELQEEEQFIHKLRRTPLPNRSEMIHCMFLIGVLKEQLYMHTHKEKTHKKQPQPHAKVGPILSRREVEINCRGNSIIEFQIMTAIYMHCKSLTISNVVPVMNNLPYFSLQLKNIYSYSMFEEYINLLIECLKFKREVTYDYSEQAPLFKKELIIFVKESQLPLMDSVKKILEVGSSLFICMDPHRMAIQIQSWQKLPSQEKQQEANELKLTLTI